MEIEGLTYKRQGTAHKSPLARQVEEGLRAIYTSSNLNDVPENARQMRTAMLDITEAWLDLIEAANGDQTEFYQATLEAVDPEGKEPNTIAFHTAKTIEAAVESADWGLGKADARDALLPAEQQPTNISYCQIFAGMRTVNLEILQQAGAVTSTQGAPPPQIPPREGVLQPSLTNRRPRVTRTAWTDWENDILRQVRADMPDASYPQITQEHNRRVRDARAAERTTMGKDRTATAVRTHMKNVLQI